MNLEQNPRQQGGGVPPRIQRQNQALAAQIQDSIRRRRIEQGLEQNPRQQGGGVLTRRQRQNEELAAQVRESIRRRRNGENEDEEMQEEPMEQGEDDEAEPIEQGEDAQAEPAEPMEQGGDDAPAPAPGEIFQDLQHVLPADDVRLTVQALRVRHKRVNQFNTEDHIFRVSFYATIYPCLPKYIFVLFFLELPKASSLGTTRVLRSSSWSSSWSSSQPLA
jgi:hypothetical protein